MLIKKEKNVITITLPDTFSADNIHSALLREQWVKFKDGNGVITEKGKEPTQDDLDDILNGTTYKCFEKNSVLKPITPEKEINDDYQAIYIQSICGYDGDYARKAKMLLHVGFRMLRSMKEPITYNTYKDGKNTTVTEMVYDEMWYLGGAYLAKGYLKGKHTKEILDWIWKYIIPGSVDCAGTRWCLTLE